MKHSIYTVLILFLMVTAAHAQRPAPDQIETENGILTVQPIQHGTLVLSWNGLSVYVDPTGGREVFEGLEAPDIILITHAHGDHMNIETLRELNTEGTAMVVPQSVADELPGEYSDQFVILNNGEETDLKDVGIKAVPMYNLPDDSDSRHPKGWGNGYILNFGGKNVYISGDTEDIPEMRSLEDIDIAFVCMNLPYTMDVNHAADAVLDFKPDIVYPYHYRGQDTEKFKELVIAENDNIEVRLKDWYSGR